MDDCHGDLSIDIDDLSIDNYHADVFTAHANDKHLHVSFTCPFYIAYTINYFFQEKKEHKMYNDQSIILSIYDEITISSLRITCTTFMRAFP